MSWNNVRLSASVVAVVSVTVTRRCEFGLRLQGVWVRLVAGDLLISMARTRIFWSPRVSSPHEPRLVHVTWRPRCVDILNYSGDGVCRAAEPEVALKPFVLCFERLACGSLSCRQPRVSVGGGLLGVLGMGNATSAAAPSPQRRKSCPAKGASVPAVPCTTPPQQPRFARQHPGRPATSPRMSARARRACAYSRLPWQPAQRQFPDAPQAVSCPSGRAQSSLIARSSPRPSSPRNSGCERQAPAPAPRRRVSAGL